MLTIQELEASGYNEAAQDVLAGDQHAAACHVLDRSPIYLDAEDHRVRERALYVKRNKGAYLSACRHL